MDQELLTFGFTRGRSGEGERSDGLDRFWPRRSIFAKQTKCWKRMSCAECRIKESFWELFFPAAAVKKTLRFAYVSRTFRQCISSRRPISPTLQLQFEQGQSKRRTLAFNATQRYHQQLGSAWIEKDGCPASQRKYEWTFQCDRLSETKIEQATKTRSQQRKVQRIAIAA